jgi:acyl dehydratase
MTAHMEYPPHTFDQLQMGSSFEAGPRTISRADIDLFTQLSGDQTALHSDEDYARTTPLGGLVAHGVLNLSAATGLAYQMGVFEGTVLAIRSMTVKYERPVYPGDAVTLQLTVAELDPRPRPDRARVSFDARLVNQKGKTVLSGLWKVLMRRSEPVPGA